MLFPSMKAAPEVGGMEPLRVLRSVVFPAPFGPSSPKHSFGYNEKLDIYH